jgi:formamidopyrimidine-DNA glycosylase
MPELPEVETIARQLYANLADKKIVGLNVLNEKSFLGDRRQVVGQIIVSIDRRAKVLRMKLSNSKYLLFHLKMTGQLIYIDHNLRIAGGHADHDWHAELPNTHTRVIFDFGKGRKLYFNDLRKFGWCRLVSSTQMNEYFTKYGPEPLPRLDIRNLKKRATKMSKSRIKKFLMDQNVVAGIGNIYADETLFAAKIHPNRTVGSITDSEWKKISGEIERILRLAIRTGGTTDSDYVNAYGKKGGMQDFLAVYHRTGEPCLGKCGGNIERIIVGGRGTHFCPNCQKENL